MSPLRFLIQRILRDASQTANQAPIPSADARRYLASRGFIHKRHELIREAGHRAADTNPTDIRTTPNSSHPAAFGHIALHDRSPQPSLTMHFGEPYSVAKSPCS